MRGEQGGILLEPAVAQLIATELVESRALSGTGVDLLQLLPRLTRQHGGHVVDVSVGFFAECSVLSSFSPYSSFKADIDIGDDAVRECEDVVPLEYKINKVDQFLDPDLDLCEHPTESLAHFCDGATSKSVNLAG